MELLEIIEIVGVVTALLYLVLVTRRSWFCWPMYIVSSCLYFPVFWFAHLYADAMLQLYFVVMGFYAWGTWRSEPEGEIRIVRWPLSRHVGIIAGIVISSWFLGYWLAHNTPADVFGYSDAFVSISSIVTTVLTARKVLEGWWYWIVIDVVASVVFLLRGLDVTIALYLVYTVLATLALRVWTRAYERQQACRL